MGIRLAGILLVALMVTGCATVQDKSQPVVQLQTQMADLQQRMEQQEKEVVDLKYEVKELSSKSDTQMVVPLEESSLTPTVTKKAASSVQPQAAGSGADIIKASDVTGVDLQKALKGAGLYDGKIDGKLGPKTKAAVVEFQRQHNLKADGVVGQKTWSELKQYLSE